MRVLWLRPSKGDNISVRRERIAEHLRDQGIEADIQDSGGLDAVRAIWRAVTGDYDVIAGNVRVGLYIGYPLARLIGKPFLGDVSDPISDIDDLPGPLFRFFEWYEWFVLKRADAAVFVYESSYRKAKERGIDAVKLPNAVDYERFAEPDGEVVEEAREILRGEGVDLEKPVAVYIGGFTENYHITDILGAARKAPGWEFVFIGEGPLEKEVVAATEELRNVHFPGAFEYRLMPGVLALARVGFCFKDAEQPLKLKEYGAAGLPTIVQPGKLERWYADELVFVEPTPEEITDLLDDVSVDGLERYGVALQQIASEYSWESIAEEYSEILQGLVSTSDR